MWARLTGLEVPDSQITNKPDAVRDFAQDVNEALAGKTLAASLRIESGRMQMAYTQRIEPAELDDLAGVEATAHLFQRFVAPKEFESRVTVVGTRVFAAAIHACSEVARVDWRADYDALDYAVVEPPEPVTAGMLAFLKYFGLSFGAFDFDHPGPEVDHVRVQPGGRLRLARRGPRPAYHLSVGRPTRQRRSAVLTDVTDLSPQEQETARFRLRELADQFTADGTLRTSQWQAVYRRTWRHPYVPCYYPELGAGPPVSAAEERQRARWLAVVYSNETWITKVIQVPSRQECSYPRFTSSSTLPSLILTMLEALDVTDGHRVLEIGTPAAAATPRCCASSSAAST